MITNLLIDLAHTVIAWLIGVRPAWTVTLPPSIHQFTGLILSLDPVIPATETLTCLGLAATLATAMIGFKWLKQVVDWIMDVIP